MLFKMGELVATPGSLDTLLQAGETPEHYLNRHLKGDWGNDLCKEDQEQNNQGLKEGEEDRLMSVYTLTNGKKIWIITEWDRSVTTILLPEEY